MINTSELNCKATGLKVIFPGDKESPTTVELSNVLSRININALHSSSFFGIRVENCLVVLKNKYRMKYAADMLKNKDYCVFNNMANLKHNWPQHIIVDESSAKTSNYEFTLSQEVISCLL